MRFHSFTHWLTLGLVSSALAGCAFIIPPESNAPRNNTVQGEIRKPLNNPAPSGKRSALTPRELPTAAPVMSVQQAALPPVDSATHAHAEKIMAMPAMPENSGRRVPAENTHFQLSSNTYPAINSVPPSPATSGSDSAQSRLSATQAELERDRSTAVTSKETLAKDAAAEPSMLSALPKTDNVVPANDPIHVVPMAPQAPQIVPTQTRRQPANAMPGAAITPSSALKPVASAPAPAVVMPVAERLPATANFAPPAPFSGHTPPMPRAAAASPSSVAAEPLAVTPSTTTSFVVDLSPSTPASITATALPAPAVLANTPTVRAGDFDPLAVADNAPITNPAANSPRAASGSSYVSNRYIAPSRYSGLRN